jgi:hypothetical protein
MLNAHIWEKKWEKIWPIWAKVGKKWSIARKNFTALRFTFSLKQI